MTSCIFCEIIAGSVPSSKVYEDEICSAFMDIQPVNPGHVLVEKDEDDVHEDSAPEHAPEDDDSEEDDPAAEADDDEIDVLEDTPDFLQETPEHDRFWFEQRPPRDFDFDG